MEQMMIMRIPEVIQIFGMFIDIIVVAEFMSKNASRVIVGMRMSMNNGTMIMVISNGGSTCTCSSRSTRHTVGVVIAITNSRTRTRDVGRDYIVNPLLRKSRDGRNMIAVVEVVMLLVIVEAIVVIAFETNWYWSMKLGSNGCGSNSALIAISDFQ